MENTRYTFIDHTADLGLMIYGTTLSELFENAGLGFFDIITSLDTVKEQITREITVQAPDRDQLMVSWLGELLFLHETQQLVFNQFIIKYIKDNKLKALASGEHFNAQRHIIKTVIKAVTYHQIEIKEQDGLWTAQVIFDL